MNVDYLLLVIDSIEEFFNQNFNLALKRKELELHKSFSSIAEEGIFLNLIGDVSGEVVLTYSEQFKAFLSSMLLEDLDLSSQGNELREEALKELLNQLSGHIVTKMDQAGYNWDIGVPHFFKKWENSHRISKELEAVEIPYFSEEIGDMKVRIAMEEKSSWSEEDVR